MEQFLIEALQQYGYIILFLWSVLEGELGLVMAGTMVHTGHMNMGLAIFIAGLGGFTGDQIYFYIGRYNKRFIHKYMHRHRRKFAIAHLLLKKYGWPIIFIQRYLYGFRTIIPMSIGLTRYDAKKFALINFISAQVWAAITIVLAYIFGEQIIALLEYAKEHWYLAIPFAILLFLGMSYLFRSIEKSIIKKREERYASRSFKKEEE
ncbi:lipoprotein B [Hydrogenimonas sp.]|nr:lipoprotein B [Hydrogenimonas sp.]